MIELLLSDPGEARTLDPLIKSQLLYQLSYGVIVFFVLLRCFPQLRCKGTLFFLYHQIFLNLFSAKFGFQVHFQQYRLFFNLFYLIAIIYLSVNSPIKQSRSLESPLLPIYIITPIYNIVSDGQAGGTWLSGDQSWRPLIPKADLR